MERYRCYFGSGVVIPVPKDKSGDLSSSKNYRAITVTPVISKVSEMCLLELFGDFLYSHDLQFGFKNSLTVCDSKFTSSVSYTYF